MLTEIVGIIVLFAAIRTLISRDRSERMLYINLLGFAMAALIALYVPTPFGAVVAIVYFAVATLTSNAIAYSIGRVKDEIVLDD